MSANARSALVDHLVNVRMKKEYQSTFPPAGSEFAEEVAGMLLRLHRSEAEQNVMQALNEPAPGLRSRIRHV